MKKKENNKKKQEQAGEKKPFFMRLIEKHPDTLRASLWVQLHNSMSILLSFVLALVATVLYLSPLSYAYSADNYKFIEDTVVNGYPLIDEAGNEVVDGKSGEVIIVPPAITKGSGIDHMGLSQRIRYYNITYAEPTTTLVCLFKTGHIPMFHAKMTFVLDSDYAIVDTPQKNFDSLQEYQQIYWITFLLSVIVGAIIIWLFSNCVWHGILVLAKKHYEKKQAQAFEKQPQQAHVEVSTACEAT